jgi:hypothetical protein
VQTRAAVRRRRIGQILIVLAVLSIGLPALVGAIFDVVVPLYLTSGVTIALLLVGMALIARGDRFYDRGFDGADDAGTSAEAGDASTDGTKST